MDLKMRRFIELTIYFTENLGRFLTKEEQDLLKWMVISEQTKS